MDLGIWEHAKEAILNLCPIIGSVNWKRRASDNESGTSPFVQFILRTAVSLVVAGILSIGGGMLSAYMVLNSVQIKMENIAAQELSDRNLLYSRQDRLEDRINTISEGWRNRNH